MTNQLILTEKSQLTIGQIADFYAASTALQDYREKLSGNTIRRQVDDLKLFSKYLSLAGIQVTGKQLMEDITSWEGITHGLVSGFIRYQEKEGFSIGSINVRLATIKRYCSIAASSHIIDASVFGLIKNVRGYSHKQGRNVDEKRPVTRRGKKKAESVAISKDQAGLLKSQPDTPQGRRDALLMCLLLDHGLRCGEIATLKREAINLDEETFKFYRQKVDLTQTHSLTKDTRIALRKYLACVNLLPGDYLLMGSRKGGKLEGRMQERSITERVNELGKRIGIENLSAHDGRHAWATFAMKAGTDTKSLQDAGGWKSPVMPLRYAASNKIANAGVKLA